MKKKFPNNFFSKSRPKAQPGYEPPEETHVSLTECPYSIDNFTRLCVTDIICDPACHVYQRYMENKLKQLGLDGIKMRRHDAE